MRKKMPPLQESAEALHQRMQQAKDVKKRQRLQALSVVVSGHARTRQELAAVLGMHRHNVAAWLEASDGGRDQMRSSPVPRPSPRSRMTPTAFAALPAHLQHPHGFAGSAQLRTWLAEQPQGHVSYAGVYAVVPGTLRATPKRPRPSHAKTVPKP